MKKGISIFILVAIAAMGSVDAQVPQNELWKNKVLYVGGSWGLGPIFGPDGTVLGGNLSPIQLDWQMTKFLSFGAGLHFYFGPQINHTAPKQTNPGSGIMEF